MDMIYSARAVKKGNSIFIIVPSRVVKELHIREGMMLNVTVDNRRGDE